MYLVPVWTHSAQQRSEHLVETSSGRTTTRKNHKAKDVNVPLCFEKDATTGKLKTGFEKLELNPWYGRDTKDLHQELKSRWKSEAEYLSKEEYIPVQMRLEIIDNAEKGEYTSDSGVLSMTDVYLNKDRMKTCIPNFLDSFTYYLSFDGVNVLDESRGKRDRLAVYLMKNSSLVAPSREEVNMDRHMFYIGGEEDAIEQKTRKRRKFQSGIAKLEILETEYDSFVSYQFAIILLSSSIGDLSPTVVRNDLQDYIFEEKLHRLGSRDERIDKFGKLFLLFKENNDEFEIRYLLKQAEKSYVFFTAQAKTFWKSQKGNARYDLGTSSERIVKRFMQEMEVADPNDMENMYNILIADLETAKVRLK